MFSRSILIAVLTAIYSLPLSAQNETENLEPLIVSATRWESVGIPTASSISVISAEEINNSGAKTIAELLRARSGVQINDQYGDGSRTSVSMRGFGANAQSNSLIMLDGRRLNNTDLAAPFLRTIALKDVERIEIIQGSSTVLFGDQAVGGVINVITRKPDEFRFNVSAGLASYSAQTHELSLENKLDNGFSYRGSYQRLESDNYRDNNEKLFHHLFNYLEYEWQQGQLFVEFQDVSEDINLPGAIFANQVEKDRKQTRFANDYNSVDTQIGRVGTRLSLNNDWQFAAEFTNRRSTITGMITNIDFDQERHNRSFNPRIQGAFNFLERDISLTAGIDWEDVDYGIISPFGVTDSQQNIRSIYLQTIFPVTEKLDFIFGARKAWYKNKILVDFSFPNGQVFKDEQFVSSLGTVFRLTNKLRFNLKYEENYRFPLIDEETNTPINVTGLNTQTGKSYEVSIDSDYFNTNIKLALYRLKLENEIDFDPVAPIGFGFTGANNNLEPTKRDGLILEISRQLSNRLGIDFSYTYVDARFDSVVFAGNRIPFVAEHQARIALTYTPLISFNLTPEMILIDERVASGDYANNVDRLPGYSVFNFAASFDRYGFIFSARANNMTNKRYSDFAATAFNPFPTVDTGYYPSPERNFFLTIGYNFY